MGAIVGGMGRSFERLSDRLGGRGLLSQIIVTFIGDTAVTVPNDAYGVFLEVLAQGGRAVNSGTGGGAAATDGVLAVTPGEVLTVTHSTNPTTPGPSTVKRGSSVLLSANSGTPGAANSNGAATSGKYPGGAGTNATGSDAKGGKGGGRLAGERGGRPWINDDPRAPGHGSGAGSRSTTDLYCGGQPIAMLSFFGSEDEATAFAKAVIPGWAP